MRRFVTFVAVCTLILGGLAVFLPSLMAGAQAGPVEVALQDVEGQEVGTATFAEAENGVSVSVALMNLPAGEHGLHVHGVGICDPPGEMPFASAGPHFNPTEAPHGGPPTEEELADPAGEHVAHAGDLGNITVGDDGTGTLEVVSNRFTLGEGETSLAGMYGSAIVVHANEDDLTSQPSGESGGRIACGVIFESTAGTPVPAASPMASPAGSPAAETGDDAGAADSVTVESYDIYYEPKEVTIPADTDVTFVLPNNGAALHTFVIDELEVHSGDIPPGETVEIVINAPAGTYEYYCDVPGHKAAGMVGTLTVE